jgi:hypothetical protein
LTFHPPKYRRIGQILWWNREALEA